MCTPCEMKACEIGTGTSIQIKIASAGQRLSCPQFSNGVCRAQIGTSEGLCHTAVLSGKPGRRGRHRQ